MKRWMWLLVFLLAFGILELPEGSVEELQPVQLLMADMEGEQVVLQTDTGDEGSGRTLEEALDHMKTSSSKKIFLKTAELLILRNNAVNLIGELGELLRPAVRVCISEDELDLTKAAEYLTYHRPDRTLGELLGSRAPIQKLCRRGEKMVLESEKNIRK